MIPYTKTDVSLLDFALPLLALANLTVVSISAFLFYRRLKKDHDWNRRQTSQTLLLDLVTGPFSDIKKKLDVEFGVNMSNHNETYAITLASLDPSRRAEFTNTAKAILNYFESISIGIRNHLFYEDMCYDSCATLFVRYRQWGKALIDECRLQHPSVFGEFEMFSRKWEKQLEEDAIVVVPPSRRPT